MRKNKEERIKKNFRSASRLNKGVRLVEQGRLIVMEGLDGSGKATQTGLLCHRLEEEGVPVKHISFPNFEKMRFYEAIIYDFCRAVIRCCLWCVNKLLQRHAHRDNLQPVRPARRHNRPDSEQDN